MVATLVHDRLGGSTARGAGKGRNPTDVVVTDAAERLATGLQGLSEWSHSSRRARATREPRSVSLPRCSLVRATHNESGAMRADPGAADRFSPRQGARAAARWQCSADRNVSSIGKVLAFKLGRYVLGRMKNVRGRWRPTCGGWGSDLGVGCATRSTTADSGGSHTPLSRTRSSRGRELAGIQVPKGPRLVGCDGHRESSISAAAAPPHSG
jgi:hypothetical protein